LLIQLFDEPADVKSSTRTPFYGHSLWDRTGLIESLTRDRDPQIGEAVRLLMQARLNDEHFVAACLKCLAPRGYGKLFVEAMDRYDFTTRDPMATHWKMLTAVAASADPIVQERLLQVVKTTDDEQYFCIALAGLKKVEDAAVSENITRILKDLPDDSANMQWLLTFVVGRFPERAESVCRELLASASARRAGTVCLALSEGNPLAKQLLPPLLDDRRDLTGYSIRLRVCDLAARAINHANVDVEFNTDWPTSRRDEAIEQIKAYCAAGSKAQPTVRE
jgi:hypothetical protein